MDLGNLKNLLRDGIREVFMKFCNYNLGYLPGDAGEIHYKHVAIGIATMTLWNLWLNQVSRFIIEQRRWTLILYWLRLFFGHNSPNFIFLTFLKKTRRLDINLSYHHAKFQPNSLKIVEVMAKKQPEPVEDQSPPALLNCSK